MNNLNIVTTAPSNSDEFYIDQSGEFSDIKLDEDSIDPKINTVAELSDYLGLSGNDLCLSAGTLKEVWDSLFLGPCRFKISDNLKFQIDPINSYLYTDDTQTTVTNEPYDNEISESNLELVRDAAIELGFGTLIETEVEDLVSFDPIDPALTNTIQRYGFYWKSNIRIRPINNLPDPYLVLLSQYNFWKELKEKSLDVTLPYKDVHTQDTLGNTVALYSYGDYIQYNKIICSVKYTLKANPGKKYSLIFDLIRKSNEPNVKSDIIKSIQVIWQIKSEDSFVKVLFKSDIIGDISINELKLYN